MKIVFDTNIYISGLLFKGGIPSRLLEMASQKLFELFFSPAILEELRHVFLDKFELTLNETEKLVSFITNQGTIIYPEQKITLIKRCPPDNRILECALAAQAFYLVTGDKKDMLPLKHPFSFKIISPAHFYPIVLK
ncbi:MAG: putative toxin-antitoxin system toxin component, PIN family [Deltaproteobacteria bacterium RIFCSPLOWO2_12_FULL_40_28]|nr:MAG: putative toxin-antitoxin system toxin component, PIN family [Deltaproteobacteria bacterium RIFCSPHIGHO2_02_FULL_40_28]OGQ18859.1 MAG: putative toxin-antitoxin system toxin component, PIN family [Deltaproteobacteria bacterium RIFCSPHIGHO2_12_FULL_40_32]OGQ40104.1 MAG: putative toxin-antitoxin system toxin component, PIN family [Deltaproteobacteria bacterium RIFCSPLOWO2_02_FULL_40_36]OGQ53287.1 MAG: putative toxin-antitoxin system toxin component, PIN family [Deltaproteobacteria bacterium 